MSLPKWIEAVKSDIHREDSCDLVLKALEIAWVGMDDAITYADSVNEFRMRLREAMRRIAELGK